MARRSFPQAWPSLVKPQHKSQESGPLGDPLGHARSGRGGHVCKTDHCGRDTRTPLTVNLGESHSSTITLHHCKFPFQPAPPPPGHLRATTFLQSLCMHLCLCFLRTTRTKLSCGQSDAALCGPVVVPRALMAPLL